MTSTLNFIGKTKGASKAKAVAYTAKNPGTWVYSTEKNDNGIGYTSVVASDIVKAVRAKKAPKTVEAVAEAVAETAAVTE